MTARFFPLDRRDASSATPSEELRVRRDHLCVEPDDECATDFGRTDFDQSTIPATWNAFEELTFDVPRRASDWMQALQRLSQSVWAGLVAIALFYAAVVITALHSTRRR